MKQFTSRPQISSLSEADLDRLRNAEIIAAYTGSLPPKSSFIHGSGIDLFFDGAELSLYGEIIQVAYKEEAFYLGVGPTTLGLTYWQEAVREQHVKPVIENIDLKADWAVKGLRQLLSGPREVSFYATKGFEAGRSTMALNLKGIELFSLSDDTQRLAFIASEDDPGDIIVLTPGHHYGSELSKLKRI